jgi:hypothetical protein
MGSVLERLIEITNDFIKKRGEADFGFAMTPSSAVCQDACIFGLHVDDYVSDLETEFGDIVWYIPWGRFTDQTSSFRGTGCLLIPIWMIKRLWRVVAHGEAFLPKPDPRNFPHRLTLGHIAAVIEKGEWFEP